MSDPFLEPILSSFDSQARIVWNLTSSTEAQAAFNFFEGDQVTVPFYETTPAEWRVGLEVASPALFSSEKARSSIRIFSGVFQAVEEFLTVRQPERLIFASKEEGLGRLDEACISRQDTALRTLGYAPAKSFEATPLADYALVKTTHCSWLESSTH